MNRKWLSDSIDMLYKYKYEYYIFFVPLYRLMICMLLRCVFFNIVNMHIFYLYSSHVIVTIVWYIVLVGLGLDFILQKFNLFLFVFVSSLTHQPIINLQVLRIKINHQVTEPTEMVIQHYRILSVNNQEKVKYKHMWIFF